MEALILDEKFEAVTIIDNFDSFIWTDRFNTYGDFELYLVMEHGLLDRVKENYYIWKEESEHVMIIEKLTTESDTENGNHLTVTGRSLESLLERRIVWKQTDLNGNLQDAVERLLNDAIINPEIADRKIPNFIFKKSTDPKITALTIDTQYTGDNLYEVITKLCDKHRIGFKIALTDDNKFEFSLYSGTDRSYGQDTNPWVIFSPEYDNIINSSYIQSSQNLKNVTLVAGQGEGEARKTTIVGSASGLARRELFTDARDISDTNEQGEPIPEADYTKKLQERGTSKLAEYKTSNAFEGEAEGRRMFKYMEDYFMGDTVQVADEYGHEGPAYIIELIFSENEEGYSMYPTFKTIQEGDETP